MRTPTIATVLETDTLFIVRFVIVTSPVACLINPRRAAVPDIDRLFSAYPFPSKEKEEEIVSGTQGDVSSISFSRT